MPKTPNSYERKPGLDSSNVDISGVAQKIDLAAGVATGDAMPGRGIELDVEQVIRPEAFDFEKFMNEPVTVMLADAPSEDDPQFAEITVNGNYQLIPCGGEKTIPRSHLAVLACAKQMRLTQKKVVNADGSMGFEEKHVLRLTYPFQVTHDANPKGGAWLRKLLQNPA